MLTPLLAAALALQPAPTGNAAVTIDALPLDQAAAVRCAVAFATINQWRQAGDARAASFPETAAANGREFFVQVMAKLMDDARLSREDIVTLTASAAKENEGEGGPERIKAMLPACQMLKSASGL